VSVTIKDVGAKDHIRLRIACFVVVKPVAVQHYSCSFRDVHPVVYKIIRGEMWCGEPEWTVRTFAFLNDSVSDEVVA
jgi:hypothetical protein